MDNSLISLMRDTNVFMKATAVSAAITFGMLILSPAAIAARQEINKVDKTGQSGSEERISAVYEKLSNKLQQFEQRRDADKDVSQLTTELDDLEDQLAEVAGDFEARFAETEKMLKAKKLPEIILQRHQDMVAHYNAHKQAIKTRLDDRHQGQLMWKLGKWYDRAKETITGKSAGYVESPLQVENENQFKRSQQDFDPTNLPFKSMQPDEKNKPKKSKRDFTQAQLFNTPATKLAELGDFSYDALAGASDPAYLAESDEINITQRIKDQAQALDYDPVKIYHWVRNNVEWQPTWGAVQDAELTLDARRGNAIDIASLTIALLRASQIPARYVHGTIEVPIAQFNNWAGGFTNSDAAVDFAASGGIPIGADITSGKISQARMEHVWVEAAIDYFPTRGAKNRAADAWVQMDSSYKQYEYLQGLDAVAISGLDTTQVANDFIASGTINEAEGWVSGFDPAILETAQSTAQTALTDYINTNLTNPTVGDVIGGRKTIIQEYRSLPSSLPNRIVVEGSRYDKMPAALQQQVTYSLGVDELRQPYNPTTFAYAALNNEKVTLSFRPETAADEAALLALLPEGEITDLSQFPSSIPSYLINVVPEFKVNGELKISGLPMRLGQELRFNTQIKFPGRSKQENYVYKVIAGSYLSVNVVAGSVSPQKRFELQTALNATKSVLESNDNVQLASLTRQQVLGDMFSVGTLSYFNQYIAYNNILSLGFQAQNYLSAGYGTIGYEPKVNSLFGLPTSISTGGVVFDIPLNVVTAVNNGDQQQKIRFKLQSGIISSGLEHIIPERMFSTDPNNPPNAISAVKAINIASTQGQRIYQLTSDNQSQTLPQIKLDSFALNEITAALQAGYEVITHTDPVSVPGYTGAGYVIFDPVTGDGAYKIGGGQNGSFLSGLLIGNALNLLFLMIGPLLATPFGLAAVGIILASIVLSMAVLITYGYSEECFSLGMMAAGLGSLVLAKLNLFLVKGIFSIVGGLISDLLTVASISNTNPEDLSCL